MDIPREQITGLVLAGGRGSRMGGVDKGLQPWGGRTLAAHALARLAPQVGPLAVNANRNLEAYAALGVPVWPDADGEFSGPLAGWLAGLRNCHTPWLVTVACDTPCFPLDLAARLSAAAAEADAEIAMACGPDEEDGGRLRTQPVFALLRTRLADALAAALHGGERKVDRWTATRRCVIVSFEDDPLAFANANTNKELLALSTRWAQNRSTDE